MFLKSLEIQGFKSFADKVYFSFSPGVTAIVGPNGSGKSNVVDCDPLVLGEQSAKTLRGAKMEDVIFSGSAGRKPVGMARVTMILDNSQRIFALDADEIEVSRTLYRSGESNYMLNKNTCRLRDIQELFMDTGPRQGRLQRHRSGQDRRDPHPACRRAARPHRGSGRHQQI